MKKNSALSWRGLAPQLLTFVILPLSVLLVAITFGSLSLHQQAMRMLAGDRDERAARAAAATMTELINQRIISLRSLALLCPPGASAGELTGILLQHRFLAEPFDSGLAYLSSDGKVLASLGHHEFWDSFEGLEANSVMKQLSPEAPPALWTLSYPFPEKPTLAIAVGSPAGDILAVGAFSPHSLAEMALAPVFSPVIASDAGLEGHAISPESSAFVVDASGVVLYSLGKIIEEGVLIKHPGVQEALQGKSGAAYLETGGKEHVVAYSPVQPYGWALVIEEPWETVATPTLRLTENAPLVLIPVVLLSLFALWFATARIVKPLQSLEDKAAGLGWGDYQAIESPVGGIAEIRHLQAELIHLAHKVRLAQQGLRDYISAMTLGQEEERRRLARELHDDTLQSLIALNQRVQLLHLSLEDKPARQPLSGAIQEILALTEQNIQNLRRLSRALRPVYLEELGLTAALEMLAHEMKEGKLVDVEFRRTGSEQRLVPATELALYRMAQEALSNVARHARAEKATLSITFTPELVTLECSDNGQGFNVPDSPASFAPGGHFGLLGMYERAEMIGAQLEIESSPGHGARITIILPLKVEPSQES